MFCMCGSCPRISESTEGCGRRLCRCSVTESRSHIPLPSNSVSFCPSSQHAPLLRVHTVRSLRSLGKGAGSSGSPRSSATWGLSGAFSGLLVPWSSTYSYVWTLPFGHCSNNNWRGQLKVVPYTIFRSRAFLLSVPFLHCALATSKFVPLQFQFQSPIPISAAVVMV